MPSFTVSLDELLNRYAPPYEDTWEQVFAEFTYGLDNAHVETLCAEYQERGKFDQPILVHPGGCVPDHLAMGLCDGSDQCCPPRVLNGRHRLAALARMGVTTCLVSTDSSDTTDLDLGVRREVELAFQPVGSAPALEENPFVVCSFRLAPGYWVATDVIAGPTRPDAAYQVVYHDVPAVLIEPLRAALAERLRSVGVALSAAAVQVVSPADPEHGPGAPG